MNEVRSARMRMLSVNWIVLLFIIIGFAQSIQESTQCSKPYEEDLEFWIQTVHSDNQSDWISEAGITHPESTSSSGWNLMVQRDTILKDDKKYYRVYVTVSPKAVNKSCEHIPDDYRKAENGKFYKYHDQILDWYSAKKKCEDELSHLAIPETDQDLETLLKLVNDDVSNWIGISDNKKEGHFLDIFGKENEWWTKIVGEYDDKTHEKNCGIIVNKLNLKPAFTKICSSPAFFICQYNIIK